MELSYSLGTAEFNFASIFNHIIDIASFGDFAICDSAIEACTAKKCHENVDGTCC